MNNIANYDLNQTIIDKFGLFRGFNSEEEDKKTLSSAYSLCFDEILRYIGEHLDDDQRDKLKNSLELAQSEDARVKILTDTLSQFKNPPEDMLIRLDNFINGLVEKSIDSIN